MPIDKDGKIYFNNSINPSLPTITGKSLNEYKDYLGEAIDMPYNEEIWNDKRAKSQSGFEKVLNSTGQMVGTFGTAMASTAATLVGGAVGLAAETADLALEGDQFNGMDIALNNPIMKGISDFDKYLKEDILPTYYTKEQQNSLLSAATGTDLLNGIGFMASAMLPSGFINGAFGGLAKMASVAKAGKLEPILDAAIKAGKITDIERGIISATARHLDKVGPITGALVGRIGESAMEANGVYENLIANGASEEEAKDLRNKDFMGNMALAVSDVAQYTRWFRGGGLGERLVKDGLKTVVKERGKGALLKDLLFEAGQEAGEEGYQFLLQKGAENSAKGKSYLEGISEASGDLFGTIEGQKSMLLGAILGGGMSSIANVKDAKENKIKLQAMANNLTANADTTQRYITDPETGKKIVNPELTKIATQFAFYEQLKDQALAEGDKDAYDVLEKTQFADLVAAKLESGQYDDFIDELKNMGESSAEEIESMFGELPTKNGIKMTPIQVAQSKISEAKRVKQQTEGLRLLPQLQNIDNNTMSYIRHKLFAQESLRNQIEDLDSKIAEVQLRQHYPIPVENQELTEPELEPQDEFELKELVAKKDELVSSFGEIAKEFKQLIAKPKEAEQQVNNIHEKNIKKAVDNEIEIINKDNNNTIDAALNNDVIIINGEELTVLGTNPETGEPVVQDNQGNITEISKEELSAAKSKSETQIDGDLTEVTPEDERKGENILEDPLFKSSILSTSGQAHTLDDKGNKLFIETEDLINPREYELNPEFEEQTRVLNKPENSNNVVNEINDTPKVITYKATIEPITDERLATINARRKNKNLSELTKEDFDKPEFALIRLTLVINGRSNNKVSNLFHDADYFEYTGEAKDLEPEEIEIAKDKFNKQRTQLFNSIKDNNGSVEILTSSKSSGMLNYNPKDLTRNGDRKLNNVLDTFDILPKTHNLWVINDKGNRNQVKTSGLTIVTEVKALTKKEFSITTLDLNGNTKSFTLSYDPGLGAMMLDLVAPNGIVKITQPFTKNEFSDEQREAMTNLIYYRLTTGESTINVNGNNIQIVGKEANPGIIDSLIYVGFVNKSKEAKRSQIGFDNKGNLWLGEQKISPEDSEALSKIDNHLRAYKSKPQFKPRARTTVLVNKFGIPIFEKDKWIVPNPTSYDKFMFEGEKPLIQTPLNKVHFVNTYFNFAIDNQNNILTKSKETKETTTPVSTDAKADIEKRIEETNNKNEEFLKQFTAINAEEVADRDNLINNLTKDIKLPANTRINNWVLEELNGKLWEGKNIKGKEEEFFGKESWNKIKEAKKQFDIEFKKIEDSNLAKIKLIEQKQSDLLNTIDGLELRKAWSFGLIEEPNIVGLDKTNFISKETEFKNGDLVETDNYEGYYYLSKPNKDDEWYDVILGNTEQEVKDKINAKYDAELKALEGKEVTPEENKVNELKLSSKELEKAQECKGTEGGIEIKNNPNNLSTKLDSWNEVPNIDI
jgi:hypothetical protein